MSATMIGQRLANEFKILELVGVGSVGTVYVAQREETGRRVAAKIIHPHWVTNRATAARFLARVRAASALSHPTAALTLAFGESESGELFVISEWLRGKSLAQVINEGAQLSTPQIVDVILQTLAGLEEAHSLSVTHGDLRPKNIFLQTLRKNTWLAKVLDYGVGELRVAPLGADSGATPAGILPIEYLSPEQIRGEEATELSDLYAVGVVLYQLLTLRLPATLRLDDLETPPAIVDPRMLAPHRPISHILSEICMAALAFDPNARFRNATAFASALYETLTRDDEQPRAAVSAAAAARSSRPPVGPYRGDTRIFERSLDVVPPLWDPPPPRRSSPPPKAAEAFVGREQELTWLMGQRQTARSATAIARVVGESGCGKTRLIEEFTEQCNALGDHVVAITSDPAKEELSGSALADLVRQLTGYLPEETAKRQWGDVPAEVRSALDELFGHDPGGHQSEEERTASARRTKLAMLLRWAIDGAARDAAYERLLVVAIDEVERLDGVSRNAILDILQELPLGPALLVVTHGKDAFEVELDAETLRELEPLAASEVNVLCPPVVASEPMLPFHAIQLMHWIRENPNDPAPGDATGIVRARIARLSNDDRQLLFVIAVGTDNDESFPKLLESNPRLAAHLERLTRRGFVREERLAHAIVRQEVLDLMPADQRRDLHEAALTRAQQRNLPAEIRALHAYHAERGFSSLVLFDRVANQRSARGDLDGAARAWRWAFDIAKREAARGEFDDPLRAVVLFGRKLADALMALGDYVVAEQVLREALDAAPASDAEQARMFADLAQLAQSQQNRKGARGYLTRAIEAARRSATRELVASLERLERSMA